MKADEKKVEKYIKSIEPHACPLCGKEEWTVSPHIYQVPEFDYNGILVSGAMYPVIAISCDNCGNTYFVNAIQAGILDATPPNDIPKL